MTRTRIYALRATSGDVSLVRAASPAAAVRHWTDSMLASVAVASQDDIVQAMQAGVEVEEAGGVRFVAADGTAEGWPAMTIDAYHAIPVLFCPYTGEPRDVRDVQSDPQGILIAPPGAEMFASVPPVPQPAAPEGMALVPLEPTQAMLDAAMCACDGLLYPQDGIIGPRLMNRDRYRAMLAAQEPAR